jgi:hypothetical protein
MKKPSPLLLSIVKELERIHSEALSKAPQYHCEFGDSKKHLTYVLQRKTIKQG